MSDIEAEEFTRTELRVLKAFEEGPPEGFVGVAALMKVTGLPQDRLRRTLNILERDGVLTRTTEMRPVKVWRLQVQGEEQ